MTLCLLSTEMSFYVVSDHHLLLQSLGDIFGRYRARHNWITLGAYYDITLSVTLNTVPHIVLRSTTSQEKGSLCHQ